MSKMQEFYNKVAKDVGLQEKFNQIVAEAESAGQTATEEKLLAFAKEEGYEISLKEMQAFFEGVVTQAQGELSDTELDQVAGGKSTQGTMSIYLSVISLGTVCALGSAIAEIVYPGGGCEAQFK